MRILMVAAAIPDGLRLTDVWGRLSADPATLSA